MKHYKKYQPYVRLANGREKTQSFREAFRLAFYQSLGKPFYVMVQRGCPNLVIGVGKSKRDVQCSPFTVMAGRLSFQKWSKAIQRHAMGKDS